MQRSNWINKLSVPQYIRIGFDYSAIPRDVHQILKCIVTFLYFIFYFITIIRQNWRINLQNHLETTKTE
jgi:hypothetical protein